MDVIKISHNTQVIICKIPAITNNIPLYKITEVHTMYWSLPLYWIKIYHEKVGVILGIPGQFNISKSINIA